MTPASRLALLRASHARWRSRHARMDALGRWAVEADACGAHMADGLPEPTVAERDQVAQFARGGA